MFTSSSAIIFVTSDLVFGMPQNEQSISVLGLLGGVLELAGGLDRRSLVGLRVNDLDDRALRAGAFRKHGAAAERAQFVLD